MKRLLLGCRTALMVCHAMIMAMTVVLPAPVASFRASRDSSGLASLLALARRSRRRLPACPDLGATSVSQMAVSTASTWQKKGWMSLKSWCRQCWSRRAVSGVTRQSLGFRKSLHWSTWRRISFTIAVTSYCCSWVESPLPSSKTNFCWSLDALRFLGFGMGVMNSAPRRFSMTCWVGCP